jgi:hypothetical protein
MAMTSAVEERLNARISPDVARMRSRTSYPGRRLALVPPAATGPAAREPHGAAGAGTQSSAEATQGEVPPQGAGQPGPMQGAGHPGSLQGSQKRAGRNGASPIRLTRRGRIVIGVLMVLCAVSAAGLIWLLVGSQAQAASHLQSSPPATHALRRIVVRPGQTLWGIAVAADPAADPRVTIQQIEDENQLSGTTIAVGQVLWVPRS